MSENEQCYFSDDVLTELTTNVSIHQKQIECWIPNKYSSDESIMTIPVWLVKDISKDLNELVKFADGFGRFYHEQFKHGKRMVCPNKKCKSRYAYFYDDFLYCPKCGHKLVKGVKEDD
jgi:hypothetical protein